MQFLALVVFIVLAIAFVAFVIYNRLVRLRNMIRESWRNIDTELQRRYDLVPNLVNTVKGYAAHEQQVLTEVTNARAPSDRSSGRRARWRRCWPNSAATRS